MTDAIGAPPRPPVRAWEVAAVLGLLAAYWVAAVTAVADKSATFDEAVYLAGGYAYWHGDYRLNAESGHLTQRVAAVPLLPLAPAFPGPDDPDWRAAHEWAVAPAFLYGAGNDADRLLARGRMACATLAALAGVLVYGWARRLFGRAGGFVSLTLFAFCPTMLANGPIVQSDLAAALFFPAATAGVWGVLHRVSPARVAVSCAALSGLFLAKLSGPLILPVAAVLVALRLWSGRPLPVAVGRERLVTGRWRQAGVFAAAAGLHAAVVVLAVWAAFGFRFAAIDHPREDEATLVADKTRELAASAGPAGRVIQLMARARVLPEAYLYGLAYQAKVSGQKRQAFLNGVVYPTGTVWYFPYSWLAKTPLPLFALLGMAAWGWARARRAGGPGLYDLAPLLALVAVYAGATTASRLNIGHRYLAPVYPPLFVLAGGAGLWFRPVPGRTRPGAPAGVVAGLLAAFALESLATWPEYLAYFNQPAGGPRNGYKHLVDSSLDWGQDLPALKRWLDAHGLPAEGEPVFLAYFGTASVDHHGVRGRRIYHSADHNADPAPAALTGGVYCVSATALPCLYMRHFRGAWTAEYEAEYQQLRAATRTPEQDERFREGAFARLCRHLRRREPDDRVGYTILVYRLSNTEVDAAVNGPLSD